MSPIFVALNFSLNPQAAADRHGLRPILNYQTAELIEQKVRTFACCRYPTMLCMNKLRYCMVCVFVSPFMKRLSKHTSGMFSKCSGKPFESWRKCVACTAENFSLFHLEKLSGHCGNSTVEVFVGVKG